MAGIDFNASEYVPNEGFELIEPGDYNAVIVASEKKPTSSGKGDLLKLELQISSAGKFQNRKLFDNLNLWNQNPQAREIARAQFSAICRAVNVLNPTRSEDLHNKVLCIKVGVDVRKDNGEKTNKIKAYKPKIGVAGAPVTRPAQTESTTVANPFA